MNDMKYLAVCLMAVFLVSCQSSKIISGINTANVAIKNSSESAQLRKLCKLRPAAVAGFDLLRSQMEISDAVVSAVYTASDKVRAYCANPPSNLGDALKLVTQEYNKILDYQGAVATVAADKLAQ